MSGLVVTIGWWWWEAISGLGLGLLLLPYVAITSNIKVTTVSNYLEDVIIEILVFHFITALEILNDKLLENWVRMGF